MRRLRPLAALAVAALIGAGCGSDDDTGTVTGSSTAREKGARFSQCMRDNGVAAFPDPDTSGELTIDAVANGTSLDTDSAGFRKAVSACRDFKPAGFTGEKRTASKQESALKFAECMRDSGIRDFPDPTPDSPLIDTTRIPSAAGRGARDIPGFTAATRKCGAMYSRDLGLRGQ